MIDDKPEAVSKTSVGAASSRDSSANRARMALPRELRDTTLADYALIGRQLDALTESEADPLANTANFVALLYQALPDINWLGVYVWRDRDLVLGPFQGNPACVRIPLGDGVCGTAAAERRSLRVADVDAFPGHIACDPVSRSELAVPLMSGDRLLGVLDIDSPHRDRFSEEDQRGVETLCERLVQRLRSGAPSEPGFI